MPATYEPISSTTLSTTAANIEFTSIPNTYTDLRIVLVGKMTSENNAWMQFNGNTGTNYSHTVLYGSGSSIATYAGTDQTRIIISTGGVSSSNPEMMTIDIFSYAGSTNKTCLITASQDRNGSGFVSRIVGLWRQTSAITSVKLIALSDTWMSGTTATLFGIKAA